MPATKIKSKPKTYMAKTGELQAKWLLVDATDKVVGRLASDIAMVLMGKHRPTYTPHVDSGDFVVVVNVDKIALSGKKWQQRNTTGTPATTVCEPNRRNIAAIAGRNSFITEAVRRMLPKNKLAHENARKAESLRRRRAPASGPRA